MNYIPIEMMNAAFWGVPAHEFSWHEIEPALQYARSESLDEVADDMEDVIDYLSGLDETMVFIAAPMKGALNRYRQEGSRLALYSVLASLCSDLPLERALVEGGAKAKRARDLVRRRVRT